MRQSDVEIVSTGSAVKTSGLAKRSHPELRVSLTTPELTKEGGAFLEFVVDYLIKHKTKINPGETLAYGYWLVKFELSKDGVLEVFEYSADATSFVKGAELTLTYWRDQHVVCDRFHAAFDPPRPDRKVAISSGLYEGDPVEGVRYPSPEHMSGWWLTTGRYDGNIASLDVVHLYHVTAARPDLARYLALPAGFRFRAHNAQTTDIWFDEKVLQEGEAVDYKK